MLNGAASRLSQTAGTLPSVSTTQANASGVEPTRKQDDDGQQMLVHGFLPWKRDTLLFGPAGVGKTTAAVALAWSVISGKPFLDHDMPRRHHRARCCSSAPMAATVPTACGKTQPRTLASPEDPRCGLKVASTGALTRRKASVHGVARQQGSRS